MLVAFLLMLASANQKPLEEGVPPLYICIVMFQASTLALALRSITITSRPSTNYRILDKMARTFFVGGNWKMNGSLESTKQLTQTLTQAKLDSNVGECLVTRSNRLARHVSLTLESHRMMNLALESVLQRLSYLRLRFTCLPSRSSSRAPR